ncbi:MAG: class I SAM-dependent RNA methyltransferase [Candidatus Flexifilum sp.]
MAGETFEIAIDDITPSGNGVGRRGRRIVYVPFTIPGERVLVRPVHEEDGFIIAEGVRLLEASADRVYPACPIFGGRGCVRCTWQHIDEPAQRLLKQDIVLDQLERVGGVRSPVVQPVIPTPDSWGYLWSVLYTAAGGALALPGREGRGTVVTDTCALIHPEILDLYAALDLDLSDGTRVRLSRGSDGGRMITLYLTTETIPELETDLPASVNVVLPDNEPMNLIGDSHHRYRIGGRDLRATAGCFFRANVPAVTTLAETVGALLDPRPEDRVLDLYAGVGVFAAQIAPAVARVTVIDSYPPAVTDADDNLAAFDHVDIIEGAVEAVLPALDDAYTAAIVDPPSGLPDAVIDGLQAMPVERLVYVSGDSARLAKDCKRLARAGYRLVSAQPIDSAPHTPYMDIAALFTR